MSSLLVFFSNTSSTIKRAQWPFKDWVMEIIGKIHPPSSREYNYILVPTYYFIKLVEPFLIVRSTMKLWSRLLRKKITYKFGLPKTNIIEPTINIYWEGCETIHIGVKSKQNWLIKNWFVRYKNWWKIIIRFDMIHF